MCAYNPTVQDRSGEILAQGTTNAANSVAQGIGQVGQSIGTALNDFTKLKLAGDQAQGTLGIANALGLIDDSYKKMPISQQIGAATNIAPLINALAAKDQAAALGTFRAKILGVQQQNANTRAAAVGAKNTGIMPWNSYPAADGLGNSAPLSDNSDN